MNDDLRHIDSVLDFIGETSAWSKEGLIYYIVRKYLFVLQGETKMKDVTDSEINDYLELGLKKIEERLEYFPEDILLA